MNLSKILVIAGLACLPLAGIFYFLSAKTNVPLPRATVNNHTFRLEIASSPAQRELGLSNRKSLPEDSGMLFLFEKPALHSFWMKDMHFSLDIIFIKDDTIVSIAENVPPPDGKGNLPNYLPASPVNKVLEINGGLAKKLNIKKGDRITIDLH